ncbi:MAG: glycosyltransferase family 2 protein, partial [Gemmatimonadales bacterium]
GSLAELVAGLAQEPTAWAAAPKILYRSRPDTIWSAGGSFDWWRGLSLDRGTDERDQRQYDRPDLVDFANACCLLVRGGSYRELGPFDEGYFMYFEDSELAARAVGRGAQVAYRPAARVLHDVQGSSGGARGVRPSPAALYYWTRNRVWFIRRNSPGVARRLVAHGYILGSRAVRIAQAVRRGAWDDVRLIIRALLDAYVRRVTGPSYPATSAPEDASSRVTAGRESS